MTEGGAGHHLVAIHDHLRAELAQLGELIDDVAAGRREPGAARTAINEMTLRQNDWTLGVYCAQYCRVVTTHHTLEDVSVFAHLRGRVPELAPVLDRLSAEHVTVHGLLEGLDGALVAFIGDATRLDGVRAAVAALRDTLLAHLADEESHLVGPLDRHGFY